MHRLFTFLYRFRAFLFFVFLEFICFWLIIENNQYQSAAFFNSSNRIAGTILQGTTNVKEYFNLKQVNEKLTEENARLHNLLTSIGPSVTSQILNDSLLPGNRQFKFKAAKVVNNSVSFSNNHITIDKGEKDGVRRGMGVISLHGVVGKVKASSENFSTVISLLHERWGLSGKITRGNIEGTVKWPGGDPGTADMLYVARHHEILKGDTVVTSGYSAVFPEGIMIGTVEEFSRDQGKPFYKVKLRLATDFTALSFVYVIDNILKPERDSLEAASGYYQEE